MGDRARVVANLVTMHAPGYYFVYIISNVTRTTIYIGVTNDLERRLHEHRSREIKGFSARYHLIDLVYFESFPDPGSAIAREKQLKGWRREKREADRAFKFRPA